MTGLVLSLKGKAALVTGGSSGLGPAIVRSLDEAGANVIVHYHANQAGAEAISGSLSQKSLTLQADLTRAEAVDQLFRDACELTGGVDIIVNCAAAESQNIGDFLNLDNERWSATMAANVDAPRILTRRLGSQGKPGTVVNITSIEATRPAGGHSHYATSKAALEMLTRATALELGGAGIRVNAIAPGLIYRDGIEAGWPEGVARWKSTAPLGELVNPEKIGSAVVFLCSDEASSITGVVLTIDAGLSTHPGW